MTARSRILVIDDEEVVRQSCARILGEEGHVVEDAQNGTEGLEKTGLSRYDLVLLDLKMPGLSGMEVLGELRRSHPDTGVIIVTGFGTIETAVAAIKLGAFDYLCKPFTPEELTAVVNRLLDERKASASLAAPAVPLRIIEGMVGGSAAMEEVHRRISKVAPTGTSVLIKGESGVGKELVARAVHAGSSRGAKPFVAVDCSGIPETLFESELFGHVAGAFTGATASKKGLLEAASDGSLFLDEVSNVPLMLQSKLLRVLQEREYRPVGDVRAVRTGFRLIAATNRDLAAMVAAGTFREDLYYRLNVLSIHVPPLRERRDDIPALSYHFLARANRVQGAAVARISAEAMSMLAAHDWPGNVRELANAIEGAVVMADGDTLLPEHLPADMRRRLHHSESGVPTKQEELKELKKALRSRSVEEVERSFLLEALQRSNWNVTHAAAEVGMQRTQFHSLMRKHGIRIRKPASMNGNEGSEE
ncbi:MAG: sigma-54 dependent transcriptional regulator [Acidobacteriota bacterium]